MNKRVKKIMGTLVIMAALICLACPAAFASGSVDIYAGATLQDNLTTSELNALGTDDYEYSTHKCNGRFYNDYSANGPLLIDAILEAIYNHDNNTTITDETTLLAAYSYIEFKDTVSPTYTSGQVSLYNVLHGYWFETDEDELEDGIEVPAILATSVDPNPIRNFHGQQYALENTAEDWTKDCDTIILSN